MYINNSRLIIISIIGGFAKRQLTRYRRRTSSQPASLLKNTRAQTVINSTVDTSMFSAYCCVLSGFKIQYINNNKNRFLSRRNATGVTIKGFHTLRNFRNITTQLLAP